MTAPATLAADSPSPDSFWESELPAAQPESELPPDDETHLINPPQNVCPTCGEEVVKAPGARGRTPKYHPECRPVKGSSSNGPRAIRVAAKDRIAAEQVEAAIDRARSGLAKAVMLLSLADPYDALVVNVNSEDLLEHARVLLMRFPKLRETASDATVVTSIFGMAVTVLSILLPIAAHHQLIPKSKLQQVFLKLPMLMASLQKRMAEMSPETMTEDLIASVKQEARKAQESRLREQSEAESVNASNTR